MNVEKMGVAFGYLITLLVTSFCAFAATYFVTSVANPLEWTPAGRLVFLGTALYVYPKLFHDD